ncbi:IS3 family transposase [Mesorhizobium sp.]|uniref:IS3 family transposase n=1 Tax=Mesorhizobium sp. TaxID=1871066 RepID=UPI0025804C14|nr:IS3 family transposase [Mesorhizobium sp.]
MNASDYLQRSTLYRKLIHGPYGEFARVYAGRLSDEGFGRQCTWRSLRGLAYKDADDARRRIGAFIDTVYNTQRLHSALHYLTPEEYEQKHSGGRQMEKAA